MAEEDFERFEYSDDIGFHFGTIEAANKRLEQISQPGPELLEGSRILVCQLEIERPLRLPDCHTWGSHNVMLALQRAGVLSGARFEAMWGEGYLDQNGFREIVEAAGYDSVVYSNETEGGGDSYIVLRAEHVRFALADSLAPRRTAALRRRPRP